MLYFSLALSLMVVVITSVIVARGRYVLAAFVAGMAIIGGCPCVFLPGLALTGISIIVLCIVCWMMYAGVKVFSMCSLCALLAVHFVLGIGAFLSIREERALREEYPIISLADRLAYEKPERPLGLPAERKPLEVLKGFPVGAGPKGLEDFELSVRQAEEDHNGSRSSALHVLHRLTMRDFINAPGFGVGRGPSMPTRKQIELPEAETIPLPPTEYEPPAGSGFAEMPSDKKAENPAVSTTLPTTELSTLHAAATVDFLNPKGFGFVIDRDHVSGFQMHHFRNMPQVPSKELWRIQSLELVSLLKYDEPLVYISKNLPRMDELQDAPTRPLNAFERDALGALQSGNNLETETQPARIRMLGAIRAVGPCLACHQVERGSLLGAFSYVLKRQSPDS
jgi:hypothetical protein